MIASYKLASFVTFSPSLISMRLDRGFAQINRDLASWVPRRRCACRSPVRARLSRTSARVKSHGFLSFEATYRLLPVPTHSYKTITCPRLSCKSRSGTVPSVKQKKRRYFGVKWQSVCPPRAAHPALVPRGCECIREMASIRWKIIYLGRAPKQDERLPSYAGESVARPAPPSLPGSTCWSSENR